MQHDEKNVLAFKSARVFLYMPKFKTNNFLNEAAGKGGPCVISVFISSSGILILILRAGARVHCEKAIHTACAAHSKNPPPTNFFLHIL